MLITSKCRAVSNYIIEENNKYNSDKTFREQILMSSRRLQKILYLCNIQFMILHNGKPLFEDSFFAWPSGPVIPNINFIYIQEQNGKNLPRYERENLKLTNEEKLIIDKILKETQELDINDLNNITNINNGPWQKKYNEFDLTHNQIIPNSEIYNFYLNNVINFLCQKSKTSNKKKEIAISTSAVRRIINRTDANNRYRMEELKKPKVKITTRRVQIILYLCQLFWYIDHEDSNMIPEDFEAWGNGPVIPEIYDVLPVYQEGDVFLYRCGEYILTEEERDLINVVVDNTIDISTETLIDYIRSTNEPWINAFKIYLSCERRERRVISKESIKQFIRKDESQKELFDFIKNETAKYESSGVVKKLTPPNK